MAAGVADQAAGGATTGHVGDAAEAGAAVESGFGSHAAPCRAATRTQWKSSHKRLTSRSPAGHARP